MVAALFVDDSTYFQTSNDNSLSTTIHETQEAQSLLEGLIEATGGAMNPEKSFWWAMSYRWNSAGDPILESIEDNPGEEIFVRNLQGNLVPLPRRDCTDAERLLGVVMCPDDDSSQMAQYLRDKTETWADFTMTRKVNPTIAWAALKTGITKTVEWPLVSCLLSEKQCDYIMQPLLTAGLRTSRIQSKFPRAALYAEEALSLIHI